MRHPQVRTVKLSNSNTYGPQGKKSEIINIYCCFRLLNFELIYYVALNNKYIFELLHQQLELSLNYNLFWKNEYFDYF